VSDGFPVGTRIEPVPSAQWTDRQRDVMRDLIDPQGNAPNVITTFVRHPDLCRAWLTLSRTLLHEGQLPSRDREIIILRVAWKTNSVYEWRQHASRVDEFTLAHITDPCDADIWNEVEQDLIRSVDECFDSETISQENWSSLARHYDDQQLLEVVFLCTVYRALGSILKILVVEPDSSAPPIPSPPNDQSNAEG
jgi:4-carboxymuconolactone decarboxylase